MCAQGPGAQTPQPIGASGQLGKEQAFPSAENVLSREGIGLSHQDSASHKPTRPVSAGLPKVIQVKNSGPTKTISEAPGTYGVLDGHNAARVDAYETTSALASDLSPEMGMALHYVAITPICQHMFSPCISTRRDFL